MLDKTASRVTYRGGEGQTVFPIPFPFLENNHIAAARRGADGAAATLSPGVDYAVNRVSDGYGELILLGDPLAEGCTLDILRRVPLTQDILFHNQGPNSPRATEEALDKLTMIAQELRDDFEAGGGGNADGASDEELEALRQELRVLGAGLEVRLAGKANLSHSHELAAVSGLAASLAAKADATALAGKANLSHSHDLAAVTGLSSALLAKADAAALAGKANASHQHQEADVDGLAASLAAVRAKADGHAARHAKGGADAITAEALGVLPAPPNDGKPYLAAAGGWIEYVAPSGGTGDGGGVGTLDHSQLLNREAADQHPQSAIQHLPRDLTEIRDRLAGLDGTAQTLETCLAAKADKTALPGPATAEAAGLLSAADKRKLDGTPENVGTLVDSRVGAVDARADGLADDLDALSGRVDGLDSRFGQLGALASAADAPANGKPHVRQDGAWREMPASSGGGGTGGAIAGEIRLLPFRAAELPTGWYFCNGDRYGLATPQGTALAALPASMKTDWEIAVTGSEINLPNLFSSSGGHFLRPVDNSSRLPGSRQADAIRNITGAFTLSPTFGLVHNANSTASGAFKAGTFNRTTWPNVVSIGQNGTADLRFDASLSVATAEENRPLNIGMTPAIYLGV